MLSKKVCLKDPCCPRIHFGPGVYTNGSCLANPEKPDIFHFRMVDLNCPPDYCSKMLEHALDQGLKSKGSENGQKNLFQRLRALFRTSL